MNKKRTRLIIEKKRGIHTWDVIAYPKDDVDWATEYLFELSKHDYKNSQLRLVRETLEILAEAN